MSLTLRLALAALVVALASMLLLGTGLLALVDRYLAERRAAELDAQAAIYAALLGELAVGSDELAAGGVGGLAPGTSARIFSTAGALLSGDRALGPFPSRAALALIRPLFPLPASQVPARSYVARAIPGGGGPLGVVELSQSTAPDTQLRAALARIAAQAALAVALLAALLSLLGARSLARPILRLSARAEALAERVRLPGTADDRPTDGPRQRWLSKVRRLAGSDELGRLATGLTELDQALDGYVARIAELEASRARFYRGVSHELRTPLTAIRAAAENMRDDPAVAENMRPALGQIESESMRLSRMLDDLLNPPDDGRLWISERRPVELGALAGELATLLEGRAVRAGVRLGLQVPQPVVVRGDRDRLKQAMINLLDNALRVTPPGGSVTLRLDRRDGMAELSVSDSGPGVPPGLRGQIWERGMRGPGDAGGSAGLGLALVREIVSAHGGRAYLDEQHHPGARMVLALPLADA